MSACTQAINPCRDGKQVRARVQTWLPNSFSTEKTGGSGRRAELAQRMLCSRLLKLGRTQWCWEMVSQGLYVLPQQCHGLLQSCVLRSPIFKACMLYQSLIHDFHHEMAKAMWSPKAASWTSPRATHIYLISASLFRKYFFNKTLWQQKKIHSWYFSR